MATSASALFVFDANKDIKRQIKSAFRKLNWKTIIVRDSLLIAESKSSLRSWGEKISVRINQDKTLNIRSESKFFFDLLNWGKNKRNVHELKKLLS